MPSHRPMRRDYPQNRRNMSTIRRFNQIRRVRSSDITGILERLPDGVRPAPPRSALDYFQEYFMEMFPLASNHSEASRRNLEENVDVAWRVLTDEEKDEYDYAEMRDRRRFIIQQEHYEAAIKKQEYVKEKERKMKEDIRMKDMERNIAIKEKEQEHDRRFSELKAIRDANIEMKREARDEKIAAVKRRREEIHQKKLENYQDKMVLQENRRIAFEKVKTKKTDERKARKILVAQRRKINDVKKSLISNSNASVNEEICHATQELQITTSSIDKNGEDIDLMATSSLNQTKPRDNDNIANRTRSAIKNSMNNKDTLLKQDISSLSKTLKTNDIEIDIKSENHETDHKNSSDLALISKPEIASITYPCNEILLKPIYSNVDESIPTHNECSHSIETYSTVSKISTIEKTSFSIISTDLGGKEEKRCYYRKREISTSSSIKNIRSCQYYEDLKSDSKLECKAMSTTDNSVTDTSKTTNNKYVKPKQRNSQNRKQKTKSRASQNSKRRTIKEIPDSRVEQVKCTVSRAVNGVFSYISKAAQGVSSRILPNSKLENNPDKSNTENLSCKAKRNVYGKVLSKSPVKSNTENISYKAKRNIKGKVLSTSSVKSNTEKPSRKAKRNVHGKVLSKSPVNSNTEKSYRKAKRNVYGKVLSKSPVNSDTEKLSKKAKRNEQDKFVSKSVDKAIRKITGGKIMKVNTLTALKDTKNNESDLLEFDVEFNLPTSKDNIQTSPLTYDYVSHCSSMPSIDENKLSSDNNSSSIKRISSTMLQSSNDNTPTRKHNITPIKTTKANYKSKCKLRRSRTTPLTRLRSLNLNNTIKKKSRYPLSKTAIGVITRTQTRRNGYLSKKLSSPKLNNHRYVSDEATFSESIIHRSPSCVSLSSELNTRKMDMAYTSLNKMKTTRSSNLYLSTEDSRSTSSINITLADECFHDKSTSRKPKCPNQIMKTNKIRNCRTPKNTTNRNRSRSELGREVKHIRVENEGKSLELCTNVKRTAYRNKTNNDYRANKVTSPKLANQRKDTSEVLKSSKSIILRSPGIISSSTKLPNYKEMSNINNMDRKKWHISPISNQNDETRNDSSNSIRSKNTKVNNLRSLNLNLPNRNIKKSQSPLNNTTRNRSRSALNKTINEKKHKAKTTNNYKSAYKSRKPKLTYQRNDSSKVKSSKSIIRKSQSIASLSTILNKINSNVVNLTRKGLSTPRFSNINETIQNNKSTISKNFKNKRTPIYKKTINRSRSAPGKNVRRVKKTRTKNTQTETISLELSYHDSDLKSRNSNHGTPKSRHSNLIKNKVISKIGKAIKTISKTKKTRIYTPRGPMTRAKTLLANKYYQKNTNKSMGKHDVIYCKSDFEIKDESLTCIAINPASNNILLKDPMMNTNETISATIANHARITETLEGSQSQSSARTNEYKHEQKIIDVEQTIHDYSDSVKIQDYPKTTLKKSISLPMQLRPRQ